MRSVIQRRAPAPRRAVTTRPIQHGRARARRRGRGQVGGGVGAQADEGRLAERGEPGDAGEQHQAERDQGVQADVVGQGDPELRQAAAAAAAASDDDGAAATTARRRTPGASVSCFTPPRRAWPCWNERHSSTGMISVKTITSLKALAQNELKLSSSADQQRAERRRRIAGEAAEDRGDEALQADQEAGVVEDGRRRPDQQARERADEGGQARSSACRRRWSRCPSGARRAG